MKKIKLLIKFATVFCAAMIFFVHAPCSANAKSENTITVQGFGATSVPNCPPTSAFYKRRAFEAAYLNALRYLLDAVYGSKTVNLTQPNDDPILSQELLENSVNGTTAKVCIVSEKYNPDGTCEITLQTSLDDLRNQTKK